MSSLSSNAIEKTYERPDCRLHQAVIVGNLEELRRCVEVEKVDVHIKDNVGLTALRHALDRSRYKMIKILIQSGADVNTPSKSGITALHFAQDQNDFPFFLDLLTRGANVNTRNEDGMTPLQKSIKSQKNTSEVDMQIFMLLLEHGAEVNTASAGGSTPLHSASSENKDQSHSNMIKMLLEKGADVNARNTLGRMPIHNLVENGNVDLVQLFLDSGADINAKTCPSRTPLFHAVQSGNSEVVELLLKHGSDVNTVDECGFTLLHQAARWNNGKIAEILLKSGVDVNARDHHGKTPLHFSHDAEVARLLLSYKADANLQDKNGEIRLTRAIREKNYEMVKMLMDQGSDVNNVNVINGLTPLQTAYILNIHQTVGCDQKILKLLLRRASLDNVLSTFHIVLSNNPKAEKWKIVLEHLAKLKTRGLSISSSFFKTVSNHEEYNEYFRRCIEELKIAKSTKMCDSWVSYFNLLIDDEVKLANYARNTELVEDFQNSNYLQKFSIFGSSMHQNVNEGIKRRKIVEESAVILNECLPVRNAPALTVKKILDFMSVTDLLALCK